MKKISVKKAVQRIGIIATIFIQKICVSFHKATIRQLMEYCCYLFAAYFRCLSVTCTPIYQGAILTIDLRCMVWNKNRFQKRMVCSESIKDCTSDFGDGIPNLKYEISCGSWSFRESTWRQLTRYFKRQGHWDILLLRTEWTGSLLEFHSAIFHRDESKILLHFPRCRLKVF